MRNYAKTHALRVVFFFLNPPPIKSDLWPSQDYTGQSWSMHSTPTDEHADSNLGPKETSLPKPQLIQGLILQRDVSSKTSVSCLFPESTDLK